MLFNDKGQTWALRIERVAKQFRARHPRLPGAKEPGLVFRLEIVSGPE